MPWPRDVRAATKQLIDQTASPSSIGIVRERSSRPKSSRGPSPTQPTATPSSSATRPGAGASPSPSSSSTSVRNASRLSSAVVFDQFEPGFPWYVFVRRGDVHLHLSEHTGDAPPGSLAYFYVDDLDAVAAEFGAPVDVQEWGRDVQLADPDGNRIRVGEARGRT